MTKKQRIVIVVMLSTLMAVILYMLYVGPDEIKNRKTEQLRKGLEQIKEERLTVELYIGKPTTFQIQGSSRLFHLEYNGMNNSETFSLSCTGRSAVNLYYPISAGEFNWYSNSSGVAHFKVGDVTPEKLTVTYTGFDKE